MNYLILLLWLFLSSVKAFSQSADAKGIFLEKLTWLQAKEVLTSETVIVIPLGAQSKEHGPHLPLNTDYIQSQFFADEIAKIEDIVIAPTMNYGFYFPFITFPGSTSVRHSVAKNLVVDICRSLAAFGPQRFYVINEGIATNAALKPAAELLAGEGILLAYTDLSGEKVEDLVNSVQHQKEGSHADEIETSKLLFMQPDVVNMDLARQEYGIRKGKGFPTFDSTKTGHYIPSGIYGDATLATKAKGEKIVAGMLTIIREDIDQLRSAPLPKPIQRDLKAYIGVYETEDKKLITITEQDGLVCSFNGLPEEKLHYEGEHYFSGFYYEAWFETNHIKEVTKLRLVDISGRMNSATKRR